MRAIFTKLYLSHDSGNFARMLSDLDPSENMERKILWDSFTEQFNRVRFMGNF